jgi:hypothetical protein
MDLAVEALIRKAEIIKDDKEQGPMTEMDLGGGSKRTAGQVFRSLTAVKGGKVSKSIKAWYHWVSAYLPAFKKGKELGHLTASVAALKVANYLGIMDPKDAGYVELKKLYSYLKRIDTLTEKDFKDNSLKKTVNIAASILTDIEITTALEIDIDITKGIGDAKLVVAYESKELNANKRVVTQKQMAEVNALMNWIKKHQKKTIVGEDYDFVREHIRNGIVVKAHRRRPRKISTKIESSRKLTKKKQTFAKELAEINKQEAGSRRSDALLKSYKPEEPEGKKPSEDGQSFIKLVTLLNAKLPQTVADNMGLPGLVYRSGRFASSVRVTDVIPTAQGYPSIGYTYQKDPYQVFEMGAGTPPWATPARDPRKVIDASIREIAQELAVGRFYTRRI